MKYLILAFMVFILAACKCGNDTKKSRDEVIIPQFQQGQIVYDKLTGNKLIVIQTQQYNSDDIPRYRVRLENHDERTFEEFELSAEPITTIQKEESPNEIRY